MTTIRDLANQTSAQPFEVAEYLDLGRDWSDSTELPAELERVWRDGLAAK